jgi:hypothetical protein
MGDMGEFWRDVRDARKAAGLPARRGTRRRAQPLKKADIRKFASLGLEQKSEWHWQMRLAGDLLDFWPSKCKWQWRGEIKTGDWSEFFALIADQEP